MSITEKTTVDVRWMIRSDLRYVIGIEKDQFKYPWSEDDFINVLRQRNAIGKVSELNNEIVGYMIYELKSRKFNLIKFSVKKDYTRQGVGTSMIEKIKSRLSNKINNRKEITMMVRESNLVAQLFFQSQGFIATGIERGYYEEEDAYIMKFWHSEGF